MQMSLRKAVCRDYAMQVFTWLLRSVSQPVCLHDLLWCLVSALQKPPKPEEAKPGSASKKEKDETNRDRQEDDAQNIATKEREEGFEHQCLTCLWWEGQFQLYQYFLLQGRFISCLVDLVSV